MSEQVSNRQHAIAGLNAYASRDRMIRNAVLLLLSYFFFSFSFNKIVSFEVFSFSYGEKTNSILKDTQHFLSTGGFHCADDVKNCDTYKTLITQQLPGIMKARLLPDTQDVFDVFDDKFSKDWHLPFPFVLHENADAIFIINAISNAIALYQEPSSAAYREKGEVPSVDDASSDAPSFFTTYAYVVFLMYIKSVFVLSLVFSAVLFVQVRHAANGRMKGMVSSLNLRVYAGIVLQNVAVSALLLSSILLLAMTL